MGREQRSQVSLRERRPRPQAALGGRVAAACALLLSLAAAAQPTANPSDFDGLTVTAIELHLPTGMTGEGLTERVMVRRGQALSRRAVRESIEKLWATERFADVVVLVEPHEGGVRLVFELYARRCIEALSADVTRPKNANRPQVLSDEEVVSASGLASRGKGECPEPAEYYPERLQQAVQGIRAAYQARGYDEADVSVELYEQTGGVVVTFVVKEGEPTRVGAISVAGEPGFALPRLLDEAGLKPGEILNRTVLDRAVERLREALREERHWRARVGQPVVTRTGRVAHISLPISAGPRFHLQFQGNRSFGDRQLRAVLGYRGNDALDQAVLARLAGRLRGFYRDSGFFDATVTVREVQRPDGAEAILAFEIEEGPPLFVRELAFRGNEAIPTEDLREIVVGHVRGRAPVLVGEVPVLDDPLNLEGRTGESGLASPLLDAAHIYSEDAYRSAADAMTALYRDRGFLDAVVELDAAELRTGGTGAVSEPTGGRGGRVKGDPLRPGEARVRFQVTEGPQTIVRELTVQGTPPGLSGQDTVRTHLSTGQPLNYGRVEEAATALTRELNKLGYLFASVSHVVSTTGEGAKLDGAVAYDIETGPQVRVGEVRIAVIPAGESPTRRGGATRTDESLVRAHLQVMEGEVLSPEALFDTQRELVLTGAFRQVGVRIVDPETPAEWKDVEVVVRESARYSGEVGGGFSLSEGPRVVVDARAPNFSGSGINLSARGKLNYVGASAPFLFGCVSSSDPLCINTSKITGVEGLGGRGNISLHQPQIFALLPHRIGVRADAVAERVHRPVYRFTRFAAITGLEWAATSWITPEQKIAFSANVQYELEHDRVLILPELVDTPVIDSTNVGLNERFPAGNYTLHNALARFSVDLRDDATNPTSGLVFSLSSELTHGLAASLTVTNPDETESDVPIPLNLFTLKTRASANFYLPIPYLRDVTLALSLQAGQIFKVLPSRYPDDPVLPKRFFLGGFSTMRGFREDAMIPQERRDELIAELRTCHTAVNPAACSSEAEAVLGGREPISEGGQQFGVAKLELRFPVVSAFNLGLFFEAGNLWREPQAPLSLRFQSLRYVAGAGLRYGTPIGPLAFDFGFNLAPDRRLNEQLFNFHFSIGLF